MTETPGVSQKDADVANSGTAVWANKFFVGIGHVVKIVFLEQNGVGEPTFFRSAVVISHQDAIALKNLLNGMLADIERQFQTLQSGGAAPPNG
jgi:hypothetical protein